jgi:hypothetical protein
LIVPWTLLGSLFKIFPGDGYLRVYSFFSGFTGSMVWVFALNWSATYVVKNEKWSFALVTLLIASLALKRFLRRKQLINDLNEIAYGTKYGDRATAYKAIRINYYTIYGEIVGFLICFVFLLLN